MAQCGPLRKIATPSVHVASGREDVARHAFIVGVRKERVDTGVNDRTGGLLW